MEIILQQEASCVGELVDLAAVSRLKLRLEAQPTAAASCLRLSSFTCGEAERAADGRETLHFPASSSGAPSLGCVCCVFVLKGDKRVSAALLRSLVLCRAPSSFLHSESSRRKRLDPLTGAVNVFVVDPFFDPSVPQKAAVAAPQAPKRC